MFDDLPEEEPVLKPNKSAQDGCSVITAATTTTPEKTVKTLKRKSPLRRRSKQKDVVDAKNDAEDQTNEMQTGDSDAELFEVEESDAPLIPLYQLRDEGATKWVLLSDLCYLLKVKSKDTLLKQVCTHLFSDLFIQTMKINHLFIFVIYFISLYITAISRIKSTIQYQP